MADSHRAGEAGPTARRDRRLALAEAPRAIAEFMSLAPAAPYLMLAPRGDGHPVLVLPGFGGSDTSTAVIRGFLSGRNLAAQPWGLGRNLGPGTPDLQRRLAERLDEVWHAGGERPVSLVGWSLGGVYARLLAQRQPERIRQVITLGSPIGGVPSPSHAVQMMRRMSNGNFDPERARAIRRRAAESLPGVPGSAVYSRTDGIVPWQIARQTVSDLAENVEVYGSHVGLGFNASVLYLLAERLAQPADAWQPFERSGWRTWVYGPAHP